jgi:hypothetical protein
VPDCRLVEVVDIENESISREVSAWFRKMGPRGSQLPPPLSLLSQWLPGTIPQSEVSGALPPDQVQELGTQGGILAKSAENT